MGTRIEDLKHQYDMTDFKFRLVKHGSSGIWFNLKKIKFCKGDINNITAFTHEFTEFTIIMILRRWEIENYVAIKYKGYKKTYIEHFISVGGTKNGRCLVPETKRGKQNW